MRDSEKKFPFYATSKGQSAFSCYSYIVLYQHGVYATGRITKYKAIDFRSQVMNLHCEVVIVCKPMYFSKCRYFRQKVNLLVGCLERFPSN